MLIKAIHFVISLWRNWLINHLILSWNLSFFHSVGHLFIHSIIHSFAYSLNHSLHSLSIQSFNHLLNFSILFFLSSNYAFLYAIAHLLVHSFIQSFTLWFGHSFIHPFVSFFTYSFDHWFMHPFILWSIHFTSLSRWRNGYSHAWASTQTNFD